MKVLVASGHFQQREGSIWGFLFALWHCATSRSFVDSSIKCSSISTYIRDHIDAQVADVPDHAVLLRGDLGVLDQLDQVLLADAALGEDVEQDDADLVVDGDVGVQEDGHNVLHVILHLLPLGIGPHGKILLHLAQFVDVALE